MEHPDRRRPAHGVQEWPRQLTVVLVTISTDGRVPWLAADAPHGWLRDLWTEARGWLVGDYLLMPDHMHFFAARGELDCALEGWIHYWRRDFTIAHPQAPGRFQPNHWDTRMRSARHFTERWEYVRQNPVRKGLVAHPDEWPYQGRVHEWMWMET